MTLYKAVRPNGTDFHTGRTRWLPADLTVPADGWLVEHPRPHAKIGRKSGADASGYLSLATVPTDCTGMRWPCLLLAVEPVGKAYRDDCYPHKRRVKAARVVGVLPAHEALGPQGEHVAAFIERARLLTADEARRLAAAWGAARDAARDAARGAARGAAWDAAWGAASDAAWDAAWDAASDAAWGAAGHAAGHAAGALVVRDLISRDHYDTLTLPWRQAVGRIHPDDPEVTR